MNDYDVRVNELLVRIFDEILVTEEKALQVGSFGDLSTSEMHTLEGIGLYDARTMTETAEILSVTTGTLTVAVDRLVRKGYVDRQRDLLDKRIVRIRLTKKGKLAYRLHLKFHTLLVDRITKPLAEHERNLLLRVLTSVALFIEEQDQKYLENTLKAEEELAGNRQY
ncbi:MAG: MarR family winged helix-turn-helix transcriptional regulator [Saccharofermentanales bacterium]